MTAERSIDMQEARVAARAELSLATLRTPQETWDGVVVPAGATGTIVDVLGGGRAYVLDFVEPYNAVATVDAGQLTDAQ